MTPYLRAHAAYHAHGEPNIPWTVALDFHLQHGEVVSSPAVFFMARPVPDDAPDEQHPDLIHFPNTSGDTWHVWAAGGDLRALAVWAEGLEVLTFQRHGQWKLRRLPVSRLPMIFSALP